MAYVKGSGTHTKVDSGWNMNSNKMQDARNSFIKKRVKAQIPMKKPIGGAIQDPIQRQGTIGSGNMNRGLQNAIRKYSSSNGNGYDSQIDSQQALQDLGGEDLTNPNIIRLDPREWNGEFNNGGGKLNSPYEQGMIHLDPREWNGEFNNGSPKRGIGITDPFYGGGDYTYAKNVAKSKLNPTSMRRAMLNRYMKERVTQPVQPPKNQLSDTLMRYLQGMFNGGF